MPTHRFAALRSLLLTAWVPALVVVSACAPESDLTSPSDGSALFKKGGKKAQPPPVAEEPTQISIYGVWHCSDDYCLWGLRDLEDFKAKNGWLVDRDPNDNKFPDPSVNLVVLSFVNPLKLLNDTDDEYTLDGVPRGMNAEIVGHLRSYGIRVMLSIGGITYVDDWNAALAADATQLGLKAADLAESLGVGIEIDYEENRNPDLVGLQAFIEAYRSVHPYDPTGAVPEARLTIDLAAGDRWLIELTRHATIEWLDTENPVLDYANAMVPNRQPGSAADAIANWQEHIDGKPQYDPPIPSLAPAKFTGSLYVVTGRNPAPECVDYARSLQAATADYVQKALPHPSLDALELSSGLLGFMFWGAEAASSRRVTTAPPNSCEGGIGVGATELSIPIPMPALREK